MGLEIVYYSLSLFYMVWKIE